MGIYTFEKCRAFQRGIRKIYRLLQYETVKGKIKNESGAIVLNTKS